ncbi:MAG: hypothetical protein ACI8P9_003392 [Parasphingorhabdus sp.]|jgi:hypothetical protein
MLRFIVDSYSVTLRDEFNKPHPQPFEIIISCFDRERSYAAILAFSDSQTGSNSRVENNTVQVDLPSSDYPGYIDMLRYEGPIGVYASETTIQLFTGDEAPGESE